MATAKKAPAKKAVKPAAKGGKQLPPWLQKATPKKAMGGSSKKKC
jgi:hypothetical protein